MKTNTSLRRKDSASTSADIENKNNNNGHCPQQLGSNEILLHAYGLEEFHETTLSRVARQEGFVWLIEKMLQSGKSKMTVSFPWGDYWAEVDANNGGLFLTLGCNDSSLAYCGVATDDESSVWVSSRLDRCHAKARLMHPRYPRDSYPPRSRPWMVMIYEPKEFSSAEPSNTDREESICQNGSAVSIAARDIVSAWLEVRDSARW